MTERVVVLCPGRGAYSGAQLGSLAGLEDDPRLEPLRECIERADRERRARDLPGLREMDAAERFGARFLRAENIAPLIFAVSVRDMARLHPERVRPVAVGGNSMGWYTALHCAGALSLDDAWTLVQSMAEATAADAGDGGGQVIYPLVDEQWHTDAAEAARVDALLEEVRAAGHRAGMSIRFGGYAVLWADEDGVRALLARLPKRRLGGQDYPLQLLGNAAFHSPLMAPASERALSGPRGIDGLGGLGWRAPEVPLVDGRGAQWRPLTTDPDELLEYTLGTQVVDTFDFAATVRVALREYAPDRIVLLGPGDSLGGAVAQVLVRERWRGIDSREAFLERQRQDPFLVSMARPEQAALVSGS